MKKKIRHPRNGDARPEYDFSSMRGGIRGKYYEQYRKGGNVVLLDPDIARAFPTEDAVNEALRAVLSARRTVLRTGGLPDRILQTTPRRQKRRSSRD
jgi:hypothetical protein